MAPIIADTSGLVAMIRADDTTHPAAVAAAEILAVENTPIIVPAEVYAETLNILGKKVSNEVAVAAGRELLVNRTFSIVGPDADILGHAVDLLEQQEGLRLVCRCLGHGLCRSLQHAPHFWLRCSLYSQRLRKASQPACQTSSLGRSYASAKPDMSRKVYWGTASIRSKMC